MGGGVALGAGASWRASCTSAEGWAAGRPVLDDRAPLFTGAGEAAGLPPRAFRDEVCLGEVRTTFSIVSEKSGIGAETLLAGQGVAPKFCEKEEPDVWGVEGVWAKEDRGVEGPCKRRGGGVEERIKGALPSPVRPLRRRCLPVLRGDF